MEDFFLGMKTIRSNERYHMCRHRHTDHTPPPYTSTTHYHYVTNKDGRTPSRPPPPRQCMTYHHTRPYHREVLHTTYRFVILTTTSLPYLHLSYSSLTVQHDLQFLLSCHGSPCRTYHCNLFPKQHHGYDQEGGGCIP